MALLASASSPTFSSATSSTVGHFLLGSLPFCRGPNLLFLLIVSPRLLSILSFHRSLELFVGLLDSSEQCQGQQALWGQPWFVHGYSHVRLGPNRIQRFPVSHPLVGCGQHWLHRRIILLVPPAHSLREIILLCFFFRDSGLSKYRLLPVH